MHFLEQASDDSIVKIEIMSIEEFNSFLQDSSDFIKNYIDLNNFKAKAGKFIVLPNADAILDKVIAIEADLDFDPRASVHLFAQLRSALPTGNYQLSGHFDESELEQYALGWGLGAYSFKYNSEDEFNASRLFIDKFDSKRMTNIIDSIYLARDLVNTPANDMSPLDLEERARDIAQEYDADIRVIKGEQLISENFPAIFAVGKGSDVEPRLIEIIWGDSSNPKVSLVGKGVCFDSGGYNLKPSQFMRNMKKDMGGAAVSLSLAKLIMAQKLPVRLRLLIPAVENMVSGNAFRPGDVIDTRKGLKIEIDNTDAEGRLVLCDALTEASSEKPDTLFDFATLTGACRVALGPDLPGFFTDSDQLALDIENASRESRDPLWRLPLWAPYNSYLKSNIADAVNSASTGFAGATTAALYLKKFVDIESWAHFDVFCWTDQAKPGSPSGGEANALRAAYQMLETKYCTNN